MVTSRRGRRLAGGVAFLLLIAASAGLAQPGQSGGVSLTELVEVADIESLAASPDGRRVALQVQSASVDRNAYASLWFVADLETGRVVQVASGDAIDHNGALETDAPIWSPDSKFLFHRTIANGAIGISRSAADGSGSLLVVSGDADVERIERSPEPGQLVYVTVPTRAEIVRAARRPNMTRGFSSTRAWTRTRICSAGAPSKVVRRASAWSGDGIKGTGCSGMRRGPGTGWTFERSADLARSRSRRPAWSP